jgi:hypothetical protein
MRLDRIAVVVFIGALALPRISAADSRLEVSIIQGAPGEQRTVAVALSSDVEIVGVESELSFAPAARIATRSDSRPACTPAPDLPFGSFAFRPAGCAPDVDCSSVRALFVTLTPVEPIPEGILFTCEVAIDANAAAGSYPLAFTMVAAYDGDGGSVPIEGIDGAVVVAGAGDGDGCQVVPAARTSAGLPWTLVAAVAWTIARLRLSHEEHQ